MLFLPPRRAYLVVAALLAALSLGACSSDQPAVCSSVDALQSSMDNLKDVTLS